MNALMWSCLIEIRDIGMQDTMELLLMEDQHVVQALSPHTPQKAFTDRIGARCVIGCFQYLNAARCCNTSETESKLAIIITDEILRRVSIGSCFPQLLCGPNVGRRARHPHMNHFARFQLDDEKRKERAEKEVSHLQEIASPHFSCMIAEKGSPVLSPRSRRAHTSHILLNRSFAHANIQLE